MKYQYKITVTDQDTGRKYPEIYADQSQIGPREYAQTCMNKKIIRVQDRAEKMGRKVIVKGELISSKMGRLGEKE